MADLGQDARGRPPRYYRPEDVLLLKGIRHLLYDQGFTIKGVQKILKDQGARHVAAIGNGGAVEALPPPTADDDLPEETVPEVAEIAPEDVAPTYRVSLNGNSRERLNAVLRDLLECKRLLERARE